MSTEERDRRRFELVKAILPTIIAGRKIPQGEWSAGKISHEWKIWTIDISTLVNIVANDIIEELETKMQNDEEAERELQVEIEKEKLDTHE